MRTEMNFNSLAIANAVRGVIGELNAAERSHPSWPRDLLRQTAVIVEEVGELQRAVLKLIEANEIAPLSGEMEALLQRDITQECRQVGAMAIRMLSERGD